MITRKMDMQHNESRIITAILKVVATAELYDPDATEETIRYCVEQDLEDVGFAVSVELLKEQEPEKAEYIWECPACGSSILVKASKQSKAIGVRLSVCPVCGKEILYGKAD